MLVIQVDKNKREPIYMQIAEEIRLMIEKGALREGEKLPPSRILAQQLGISRQTVTQAYSELWSLGYLISNSGSYTRVRKRPGIVSIDDRKNCKIKYDELIGYEKNKNIENILDAEYFRHGSDSDLSDELIDMSVMDLDSSIFPITLFRKSMNKVLNEYSPNIFNYCEYKGFRPLRKWISDRMKTHSVDVDCEEILITNGVSQATELLVRLFTESGDVVFIESPGYRIAISLFRIYGLEVVGIPLLIDGMDLDFLEKELKERHAINKKPKFIYTVPSFQNPTGITTSQPHREKLLGICEKYAVPLIEDSFEEEVKYFDKVVLPIKSMDKFQSVFYLGTFSKVLFPGLRIGWVAGNRGCVDKLTALKGISDLSGNSLSQAALYEFCDSGHYDAYIRKMNRKYLGKMNFALECLKEYVPEKLISWAKPSGGYLIWLKVRKKGFPEEEFKNLCLKNRVKVAMGSAFFYDNPDELFVRLCISPLDEEKIAEGIRRFGKSVRDAGGII